MWTGLTESNAFASIGVIQIYFLPNARQPNIPSQLDIKKNIFQIRQFPNFSVFTVFTTHFGYNN